MLRRERSGDWENFLEKFRKDDKPRVWASMKVCRGRRPVQHLRRTCCIKVLVGLLWAWKEAQCGWWRAACGGQFDWRAPNRISVIQDSMDH